MTLRAALYLARLRNDGERGPVTWYSRPSYHDRLQHAREIMGYAQEYQGLKQAGLISAPNPDELRQLRGIPR